MRALSGLIPNTYLLKGCFDLAAEGKLLEMFDELFVRRTFTETTIDVEQ